MMLIPSLLRIINERLKADRIRVRRKGTPIASKDMGRFQGTECRRAPKTRRSEIESN